MVRKMKKSLDLIRLDVNLFWLPPTTGKVGLLVGPGELGFNSAKDDGRDILSCFGNMI